MAIYNHEAGIKLGMRMSAELLIRTAQDYEQMADQVLSSVLNCKYSLSRTVEMAKVGAFKEKAALLRGQAALIMEMKP